MADATQFDVPKLERRRVTLSEMSPLAYNPRVRLQPGTRKYEELKQSILTFGEAGGIVWNRRTGNIVGGHQRYFILQDLGEEHADVTVVDLDEEREKALNIRLNVPGSDWDYEMLQSMYDQMDMEMQELTGMTRAEIEHELRRQEMQDPDAFLDDMATGGELPGVGAPELKDDHPHRTGDQYFTYQIVLTSEQRDIYFAALDRAKRVHNLDNSMDAITAICSEYLAGGA